MAYYAKFTTAWPIFASNALRNAQSPWEQIVRSEAKISTVSSGADRSERSEDKNGVSFS